MAVLIPCLEQLRAEFNALGPKRDKGADGWIGDKAHQKRVSDHNPDETGAVPIHDADHIDEVHAIDIDKTGPWLYGATMPKMVAYLLSECRKPGTSGKDRGRLRYIIWDRHIYEAPKWEKKAYKGSDPHTNHAHFSAEYVTKYENDKTPWGLEAHFKGGTSLVSTASEVWGEKFAGTGGTQYPASTWLRNANIYAGQAMTDVKTLLTQVAGLRTDVAAALGRDPVDEQAIAAAVLAGIDLNALAGNVAARISAELPDGPEIPEGAIQRAFVGALQEWAQSAPQVPQAPQE